LPLTTEAKRWLAGKRPPPTDSKRKWKYL